MANHISVWLGTDERHLRSKFHCPQCGNVVAEVQGKLWHMTNGDVSGQHYANRSQAVTVMCKGSSDACKMLITFYS